MPKAEISWKRTTDDGVKLQVNAQRVSREWRFSQRERRFDQWQPVPEPPLETGWLCSTRCNGSSPGGVINPLTRSVCAARSANGFPR